MVTNNSCNYAPTQYLVQFGGANGNLADVTNGTTGQFLGANTSGPPTWQTPPGAGGAHKIILMLLFHSLLELHLQEHRQDQVEFRQTLHAMEVMVQMLLP